MLSTSYSSTSPVESKEAGSTKKNNDTSRKLGKGSDDMTQSILQQLQLKNVDCAQSSKETTQTNDFATFERVDLNSDYENLKESFDIDSSSAIYHSQFASIYYQRLTQLRGHVLKNIKTTFGDSAVIVDRILDIIPNKECALVGTLFKQMSLKPNIINEFLKEKGIEQAPEQDKYCSEDDCLILEDETGRAVLSGNLPLDVAITGK